MKKMKVLWFTSTSSLYELDKHQYYGCGWVESLQHQLVQEESIDLAISFFHTKDSVKKVKDNTTYYPLYRKRLRKNPFKTIYNNYRGNLESEKDTITKMLDAIEDFKPDVINVFGSEGVFSSIQQYTKTPVVIHIQGVINPIIDSYFPPGVSKLDFLFDFRQLISFLTGTNHFFKYKRIKNQGARELKNLRNTKYVFGRTNWDHSCMKLFAPSAKYFHIDEILRDNFYENSIDDYTKSYNETLNLVSTTSSTIYKGLDVILKTALLLSRTTNLKICWKLIGVSENDKLLSFFERKYNIKHQDFGIKCVGVKKPSEFISIIKQSNIYIHTSYIENSPNSICEAQLLGTPVIATNAGGVSTMIEDGKSGFLVPLNGVVEIVDLIREYNYNISNFTKIGENAKKAAIVRHDKNTIVKKCLESYASILKDTTGNN